MIYTSTRAAAFASGTAAFQEPPLGFEDVLLAGLARDGGLYLPRAWPRLAPQQIAGFAGRPYAEVALAVLAPFIGDEIPVIDLQAIVSAAYRPPAFGHPAVAPLIQLGPQDWLLELFHGPTLAFKDIAMQVLAPLINRSLLKKGRRATIVGATSGDTGGAAIEAFRGRAAIDIFILYPQGRVSDVQRRQMTTPVEDNVHALAIEGTFDDCQNIVKALFNDLALRDRLQLSGVNSINWARLMAQVVYYFTAGVALGAPHRAVSFCVPTGNFGDVFAGYVAKQMGLPIEQLIIATNANDILARTLETGRYELRNVVATHSPSMDIQISSNFERLLYELCDRSGERVVSLMAALSAKGSFALLPEELARLRATFRAYRADETETAETITRVHRTTGYVADPHTAVGLAAAARVARGDPSVPMITLATAHPAKFPDAVEASLGKRPDEPEIVARQRSARERLIVLPNDKTAIAHHISEHSRAATR